MPGKWLKNNLPLVLICGLNFILSLLYLFRFTDPFYVINHEATQLAWSLATGQGYVGAGGLHIKYAVSALLQPVYPCLLALLIVLFKLPNAFLALRLLQALMCAALCAIVYGLGSEIFGRRTGLAAALIFAFYLLMATMIWDTLLVSLLVPLAALLALRYDNQSPWRLLALGLALGAAVMTNAVTLLLLPAVGFYLLGRFGWAGGKTLRHLLLILAVSGLLFLPWSFRNIATYGGFMPVRSGFWGILELTDNPDATGTIWLKHDGRLPASINEGITLHYRPMIAELAPLDEYRQDQYFKAKFFAYVLGRPLDFVRLLGVKFYYFVWFSPFDRVEPFWLCEYLFVLLWGAAGLYRSVREKKRVMLFVLLFVFYTGVYTIMGPLYNWKYRLPVEPLLIVLAGYGLSSLIPSVVSTTAEGLPEPARPGKT
jgi:4-amino-4-deoxy-L-arabinose transferase-like glycosyltransferase